MTERKIYNKLVRDRIPEIIAADGHQCATETMNEGEYRQALQAKLVEEAQEVASAEAIDMVTEIADLYEVVDAMMLAFNLDKEAVLATQKKRCDERGGFEKHIKVQWTD